MSEGVEKILSGRSAQDLDVFLERVREMVRAMRKTAKKNYVPKVAPDRQTGRSGNRQSPQT